MAKKIIQSKLLCPRCRNYTTIYRNAAKRKHEGHYKKIYCYTCKSTHNHIELKTNYNYTEEEIEILIEQMKKENRYELEGLTND
jgi:hypothetical protein